MFSNLPVKAERCLVSMEMSYRITENDQKRASLNVVQHVAVVKHKRIKTNRETERDTETQACPLLISWDHRKPFCRAEHSITMPLTLFFCNSSETNAFVFSQDGQMLDVCECVRVFVCSVCAVCVGAPPCSETISEEIVLIWGS